MDNIIYEWILNPIYILTDGVIPQYSMDIDRSNCSQNFSAGNYMESEFVR